MKNNYNKNKTPISSTEMSDEAKEIYEELKSFAPDRVGVSGGMITIIDDEKNPVKIKQRKSVLTEMSDEAKEIYEELKSFAPDRVGISGGMITIIPDKNNPLNNERNKVKSKEPLNGSNAQSSLKEQSDIKPRKNVRWDNSLGAVQNDSASPTNPEIDTFEQGMKLAQDINARDQRIAEYILQNQDETVLMSGKVAKIVTSRRNGNEVRAQEEEDLDPVLKENLELARRNADSLKNLSDKSSLKPDATPFNVAEKNRKGRGA